MSAAVALGRLRGALTGLVRNEAGAMLFAFTAATILLRLGGNIVLTRLLDPDAFGVVGIIVSVMMVLAMLSDLGVVDFVIRHAKGGDRHFLDVVWTVRLGQGSLQALAMLAGAVPITALLHKPELAGPIAATAPLFLLNALCPMTLLLARREGRVRATCAIELIALAIQIAANLGLTLLMPDYRALVIGLYVNAVARLVLTLLVLGGGFRPVWDGALAREFLGFSRWIMASTLLTLLITQSDKILFARLFTMADFGIYMLAANLALALQPFGRNYVERYFFPLVSRVWHDTPERLGAIFYAARARLYPLLFAGFGFGVGFAPCLFGLLFDRRYEHGWIYLSVMILRMAFELDSFANIQTAMAMGRTRPILTANIIRFILFVLWVAALFRPLGPIALPVALTLAELGALVYSIGLLRRAKLFRLRAHALYYAVMVGAALIGAALSLLFARDIVRAGLALIG
ncbi:MULTISPECIES: oligosaccharide flippase family protein [unclassified Sphingomonas]|uniref:oligosaccharide flippase family protein n=1 Tax=unclassified Sphingomonas TaxID=196159 RepID=UPI0007010EF2|nr:MULTISPECIES: oligosaccharide flippase family protein [unclassified Sphingomonas]KQX20820.1 polysaccharide biosynthesis protein [Sphingomonas sp. Root1294]KQY68666.1 polysaccharide biosynthesis protein [Sphingomonas sp. Root50]KRB88071.1 polysaccharide biosynthesis protein [Sphingomonas sp. Root720]